MDESEMMERVRSANARVASEQTAAREAVIPAIRAVEHELKRQLGDGCLRGFKNVGFGANPFYAARVRGKCDTKLLWPDESNAQATTLVLTPDGCLMMAVCMTDSDGEILPTVGVRVVLDDELRVEDLQEFLQTLAEIVPRHVANADRATERYINLRGLSDRIAILLKTYG
jgi:hypothetical protein